MKEEVLFNYFSRKKPKEGSFIEVVFGNREKCRGYVRGEFVVFINPLPTGEAISTGKKKWRYVDKKLNSK